MLAEWNRSARPDQQPPDSQWRTLYLQGGRGSGKTRAGAQTLARWVLTDPEPNGEYGIVAPTYRDAWSTCVSGESGLLAALGTTEGEVRRHGSPIVVKALRSVGEVYLANGHLIRVDSADDGALRVQGKNLRGVWADEVGLWSRWSIAWDESIAFAVRQGRSQIIATGTPKISRPAAALIRRLIKDDDTIVRRLRTVDNLANLSDAFYRAVVSRAKGTRLERQELEGELLDDVENALWTRALLDGCHVDEVPYPGRLVSAVVGVDPSDGDSDSDEQAYTVCGKGMDHQLYVVESYGARVGPVPFLREVVAAAKRWDARIVLEKNHGGAYLAATLDQVLRDEGASIPYDLVTASHGKRTRAEPVAGLYERGHVRHVGVHVDLEDQMATFTGMPGERSPDRLDSLVWSVTPYLDDSFDAPADTEQTPWPGGDETAAVFQWATHGALDEPNLDYPTDEGIAGWPM